MIMTKPGYDSNFRLVSQMGGNLRYEDLQEKPGTGSTWEGSTRRETVYRENGLAVSGQPSDKDREIQGYIATWSEGLAGTRAEDGDSAAYIKLDRHAFDRWLSRVNPTEIPIVIDHQTGPVGHWLAFHADEHGLRGIGEIDESPAGDLVLAGCLAGVTPGLSYRAGNLIIDADEDEMRDGTRALNVLGCELVEAGPTVDPADIHAIIEEACGEATELRRREAALERDRVWRQRTRQRG